MIHVPSDDTFWRAVQELARGESRSFYRAIKARSATDPTRHVWARYSSRPVEMDGTFPVPGTVHMVDLTLWTLMEGHEGSVDRISYEEATAWWTTLLPGLEECYLLDAPPKEGKAPIAQWFFDFFVAPGTGIIPAAEDFAWSLHRIRGWGMTVDRVDRSGAKRESVYRYESFPPFHAPYMDSRGRYDPIDIEPPPAGSGIAETFDALARAIPQRGLLDEGIRPVSLRWTGGDTALLGLTWQGVDTTYYLEWHLPDRPQIASGSYVFPSGWGSMAVTIRSPEQCSAAVIGRLNDMGRFGVARTAVATDTD